MNGINYLADTNAVLYFLSGKECMKPFVYSRFAVSVINELELLSFPKITDEEERQIRRFIEKSVVLVRGFGVAVFCFGVEEENLSVLHAYNEIHVKE